MAFNLPRLDDTRPDRTGLGWLLAIVVLVVAVQATRLPVWLTLIVACLLTWQYLGGFHGWRRPGRVLRTVLALVLVAAVYRQFGTIAGRDAGIAFLVGLLSLKCTELNQQRDYVLVILLCYFLMVGGFLFDQTVWMGAYMFTMAVLATATLIRLAQPVGIGLRRSLRLAVELLALALPLMLVLYLFFPRIQGSLWGLPMGAHSGVVGMSPDMSPGSLSKLSKTDAVAFRVLFHGAVPPYKERYWRVLVLTQFDGRTWRAPKEGAPVAKAFAPVGQPVRYTVLAEPSNEVWIYALDRPANVPANAERTYADILRARRRVVGVFQYDLVSYPRYNTGALASGERARNLELPRSITARVRALAMRWKAGGATTQEVVNRALNYFRTQDFSYTLNPPLLGAHPVDQFLFQTRRGFCEHYASAFVTLMRAAGIPSRVVVGYLGGEPNPVSDYYLVYQADAHAWAEVWMAKHGWVRVDPTAAVAPERVEFGSDVVRRLLARGDPLGRLDTNEIMQAISRSWFQRVARAVNLRWDAINTAWNRWVLDFGPERQAQLLRLLGFKTPTWVNLAVTLTAGMILALLAAAAGVLYRRRRPDPVVAAYDRFCRRLARLGLRRETWEGPLDFARRCAAARPDLAAEVDAITGLYLDLRYRDHDPSGLRARFTHRVRGFHPRRRHH